MKNIFRRLSCLYACFSDFDVYSLNASPYSVSMTAIYSANFLLHAIKYKFVLNVSPSGYIWLSRGIYHITLTD